MATAARIGGLAVGLLGWLAVVAAAGRSATDPAAEGEGGHAAAVNATAAGAALDPGLMLAKLHQMNDDAIALGTLAAEKGEAAAVREYGARVVANHRAADAQVMHAARARGLDEQRLDALAALGRSRDEADWRRAGLARLEAAHGAAFDTALADTAPELHRRDIAVARTIRTGTADPRVANLAAQLLPTLEEQQRAAASL
jgi:putative membrane protein